MKILIADDHSLIRSGLRSELAGLAPAITFVEAWDLDSLRDALDAHRDADLALVDLGMPGMDGVRSIERLRADHPTLPLVVVSASDDAERVRGVLRAGAAGFIPKSSMVQLVLPALRLVLAGGQYVPQQLLDAGEREPRASAAKSAASIAAQSDRLAVLSPRQREVFDLLARGLSNKRIARELDISEGTVKSHVATIFDLLNVHNRVAAVAEARAVSGDAN
jgi:DNA-binding NarL/FixJ family response regulator